MHVDFVFKSASIKQKTARTIYSLHCTATHLKIHYCLSTVCKPYTIIQERNARYFDRKYQNFLKVFTRLQCALLNRSDVAPVPLRWVYCLATTRVLHLNGALEERLSDRIPDQVCSSNPILVQSGSLRVIKHGIARQPCSPCQLSLASRGILPLTRRMTKISRINTRTRMRISHHDLLNEILGLNSFGIYFMK